MEQFTPDERKRGIDFALRVLSQLETTMGSIDEPDDPAPSRVNGKRRREL